MSLSRYEQETIINFNEGEDVASVYTHNKALRRKLEKLAQKRPEDCRLFKVSHGDQAVEYYIPKKWVKVTPTRILSEEQKAAKAAIARKAFLGRNTTPDNGVGDGQASGDGNLYPLSLTRRKPKENRGGPG